MEKKIALTDQRMLRLKDYALKQRLVSTDGEYFGLIGFHHTNICNIRNGRQRFTVDHITAACKLTGANANWILGLDNTMMRKEYKLLIDKLREMVISLESEQKEPYREVRRKISGKRRVKSQI
jgi:hypothetical protein